MNIWAKMMSALQDTGEDGAGEAQALRILDQEIREASEELSQIKSSLALLMSKENSAKAEIESLSQDIETHEQCAISALANNDSTLAYEAAQQIAQLNYRLDLEKGSTNDLLDNEKTLQQTVHQLEQHLRRLKQQVDTVRANESVLRAQEAVANRNLNKDGPGLRTAMDSIKQIKNTQEVKRATIDAAKAVAEKGQEKRNSVADQATQKNVDEILNRLQKRTSK